MRFSWGVLELIVAMPSAVQAPKTPLLPDRAADEGDRVSIGPVVAPLSAALRVGRAAELGGEHDHRPVEIELVAAIFAGLVDEAHQRFERVAEVARLGVRVLSVGVVAAAAVG